MADDLFDVLEAASDEGDPPRTKVRLRVHVRPGSGKSGVVGKYGNALHVRVAAPPVGGRANAASIELLSDVLGVDSASIELVGGERSVDKRFVLGVSDLEELRKRLDELVSDGADATGGAVRGTRRAGKHRPRR